MDEITAPLVVRPLGFKLAMALIGWASCLGINNLCTYSLGLCDVPTAKVSPIHQDGTGRWTRP